MGNEAGRAGVLVRRQPRGESVRPRDGFGRPESLAHPLDGLGEPGVPSGLDTTHRVIVLLYEYNQYNSTMVGKTSFRIRPGSGEPIYLQLVRQVKNAISTGVLRPGDQLPTVRQLATDLVVNPNTVARAYRELEHAGVLDNTPGRGSFVGAALPSLPMAERKGRLQPYIDQVIAEAMSLGYGHAELVQHLQRSLAAVHKFPVVANDRSRD